MWSTLRRVAIDHDEHIAMCDLHLLYLGFGAFIKLIPVQAPDNKDFIIIGTITAEDRDTIDQLNMMAKNQDIIMYSSTPLMPTAAAGSTDQLPKVECEQATSKILPTSTVKSKNRPEVTPTIALSSTKPDFIPGVL